ncbi:uncharacterized protein LOC118193218 [Stegodyphus dumicola]|uniref:uncharacterized protein LOC118193218 n=1 Tax=Stegodyphus dumicola TaxID=202533 RepID=UPI0015ABD5F5|nr:uncharacterized protein LOC118193218 [Stegodyphus dumicola]
MFKTIFSSRGKSSCLFSDNATNFVGAHKELKKLASLVTVPDEVSGKYLASENITCKFIPPRASNFGGIWEAGIKSFKFHLKRTISDAKLTYEEFLTVIDQIEGILNSRPLSPLSSEPSDYEPLTAGHFLIGRPINSIVEPQILDFSESRLSRWQKLTKMIQIIWKRWITDYVNHLQQ